MARGSEGVSRQLTLPREDPHCQGAVEVVERLAEQGYEAYLVGGCVRDLALGRSPKDYDIATGATPQQVQQVFRKTVAVGKSFGVVRVLTGGQEFDVATFRKDSEYVDGRRPEHVEFCSVKEDVLRRDFRINGLLYDHRAGEILDYVGGLEDLDRKVVSAIGDPGSRFQEDHLRVLRAIRFAAELQFVIQPETYRAVQEFAGKLVRISRERIRDEFLKILTLDWLGSVLELVVDSGVSPHLAGNWAERTNLKTSGRAGRHELDRLCSRFEELKKLGQFATCEERLLALIAPPCVSTRGQAGGRVAQSVDEMAQDLSQLRLSGSQEGWLLDAIDVALTCSGLVERSYARHELVQIARRRAGTAGLGLALADARVSGVANIDNYEGLYRACVGLNPEDLYPPPLLNGDDLKGVGISAGPEMGRILRSLEAAQLDGELKNRDEALRFVATRDERGET